MTDTPGPGLTETFRAPLDATEPMDTATHQHCDSDPIECSVQGLEGELAEARYQLAHARRVIEGMAAPTVTARMLDTALAGCVIGRYLTFDEGALTELALVINRLLAEQGRGQ